MNRIQNGKNRLTAAILAVLLLLSIATPALAETFSAIVTSNRMTVYRDAAMTQPQGSLARYTIVSVTAYSGRAAKIRYSGKTGYASINDMRAVEAVGVKAVTNQAAKVYQSANVRARSAAVPQGTQLYVLAISDSWAMVVKGQALGFMNVSALTKADDNWRTPDPNATATPAPAAPARSSDTGINGTVRVSKLAVYKKANAKSTRLATLKKGQSVKVYKWNDTWAYIEVNGKRGFCAVKGLTKASESNPTTPTATPAPTPSGLKAATVSASKLPVYRSASTKSAKLGTMKKGQSLNLVAVNGSWAYVELNGRYGYCAVKGLSYSGAAPTPTPTVAPTPTPSLDGAVRGAVTAATLDVYSSASTGAKKVMTLKKGQLVNVIRWNGDWAFIELDGAYGFCALKGLSRTDASPSAMPTATPSTENAVPAVVTANRLPVHRLAGDASDLLGTLKKSQVVNVLSLSGDWAYIELAGRYGFCRASGLKLDNQPAVPSDYRKGGFTATVIQSGVRAYASPTTTSDSVSLALGASVNVFAYSSEWACIVDGGSYAFVPVNQLSRTAYGTVTGGAELQKLLKTLLSYGYYDGVPSTTGNSLATTAIQRFQAACGLSQTGVADETLQRILYGGYAPQCTLLSKEISGSSSSADITRLQTRLYALGYLSKASSVDGGYGTITTCAVGLFQKANGLTANGAASVATLKAIYSAGAVRLPSGAKAAEAVAQSSGGSGVVTPPKSVKLSSTYVTTMPAELKSKTSSYSSSMSNAQKLEHVIYSAQEKLGRPYVYGATGPSSFDCSGLTGYAFRKVSVSLKRTAYSQGYDSSYAKISGVSSLKRGDLVFFNTISDSDLCDHVGIYLGGGCFIHASSGGHKVVVSNIASGYYNRVFSWGRRVLG